MRFRGIIILCIILTVMYTGIAITEDSDAAEYYTHNIILKEGLVFNESEGEKSAEMINDAARFSICYYEDGTLYFTRTCSISFELTTVQNAMTFNNTNSNGIYMKDCSIDIYYNCQDSSAPAVRYAVISAQCDHFTLSGNDLYLHSGMNDVNFADQIDAIYCKGDMDFNKATVEIDNKSISGKISRYFGYAVHVDGNRLYIKESKISAYSNIYNICIDGDDSSVMEWNACKLYLHANEACFHCKYDYSLKYKNIDSYLYSPNFSGSGYINADVGTNLTVSKYVEVTGAVKTTTTGPTKAFSVVFVAFVSLVLCLMFILPLLERRKVKVQKRRENAIRMQDVSENIFRMIDDNNKQNEDQSPTMITVKTKCYVPSKHASFRLELDKKTYGDITRTESSIEISKGNHVVKIYDWRKKYIPIYHETVYFFGNEKIVVSEYLEVYDVCIRRDDDD